MILDFTLVKNKVSERYIAPCFVNGLEAYDGEINLAFDENLISNEYAVKLCLDYEVKKGNKVVKKELIVALKGELYFVKFIINLEKDDVEPGVILGRSFMRLVKGIVDFGNRVITVYPEPDPFEEDFEKTKKITDDWDQLFDFNFDDIPKFGEELPPFVCKIEKSNQNKKRSIENLSLFYQDIRTSSSPGGHLTQQEATKEALAIRISQKFALLEADVLNIMRCDGEIDDMLRIKLCEAGSNKEILTYVAWIRAFNINEPIYAELCHEFYSTYEFDEDVLNIMRCDGEINDMLRIKLREARSNEEIFTYVAWIRAFNINESIYAELCHEFYSTYEFDKVCADDELQTKKIIKFRLGGRAHSLTMLEFARRLGLYQVVELDEEGFNVYFEGVLRSDGHFNAQTTGYDKIQKNDLWLLSTFDARHQNGYVNVPWLIAKWMKRKGSDTQQESQTCYGQFILKIARNSRVLTDDVLRSLNAAIYCRMEICQEAIEQMEYRQSYHWDMYQGVFEHMAGVYNVPLQGAYNPPGYAQPQYDQYYQQYPPPPPKYPPHQQQHDNQ
nr:hypothetical protein [Tanacetum cinerariifolium]